MTDIRLERLPYDNGQYEYKIVNGSDDPFGFLYYSETGNNARLKVELGERNFRTVLRINGEIMDSESHVYNLQNRNFDDIFQTKLCYMHKIAKQLKPKGARRLLKWMIENERMVEES
ncbi:hypothetical protein COU57_05095 [Candidatus Pacearchaeota archaeon CG10_big_fil_rev_8_21_14_0_10_32_14]|nr:MAG: hypothetical protein COU57_05095 [Candidatus Pacearchaeota archaeon CG10_big_fil_rev_8_21_14_0_10_32_14]